MVNVGLLAAEIGSEVWGTPSEFQRVSRLGFVTAPTSLNADQPNFARCLAVSWTATLYTLLGALAPKRNSAMRKNHFESKSCVLLY